MGYLHRGNGGEGGTKCRHGVLVEDSMGCALCKEENAAEFAEQQAKATAFNESRRQAWLETTTPLSEHHATVVRVYDYRTDKYREVAKKTYLKNFPRAVVDFAGAITHSPETYGGGCYDEVKK